MGNRPGETETDGTLGPVGTRDDGAELLRGVGGTEGGLIDEAGRDGGPIGLSGIKIADVLVEGEGDGGIRDRVSIVRSESEGLVLKGTVVLVSHSFCSTESTSSSWSSGSAVSRESGRDFSRSPGCPRDPLKDLGGDVGREYICLKASSDGRRNLDTFRPRSACSLSLEGDRRRNWSGFPVGRGSLEGRGMPLGLAGRWFSIFPEQELEISASRKGVGRSNRLSFLLNNRMPGKAGHRGAWSVSRYS